jgi:putative spermidine/putrescine transport system permease protein
MADFETKRGVFSTRTDAGTYDAGLRKYMLRVYNLMFLALVVTGATSYFVFNMSVVADPETGRLGLTSLGQALFLSPLMIPHVVLGIAFLRFFTSVGIGGTFVGLVIAHVVVVFPFALRLTLAAATGMDRTVEMAAVSLGADGWTLFRRVTLPLILPGVISGWALAFIQSFDDLTMTVFLAAPGTETLPVRMFLYIQDNIDPLVTSVSACVIAITMTALILLDRFYGLDRVLAGKGETGR